jgi:hypothetical protein
MITNNILYKALPSILKILKADLPMKIAMQMRRNKKVLVSYVEGVDEMVKEIKDKYKIEGSTPLDKDGKEIPDAYYISQEGVKKLEELMSLEASLSLEDINLNDLITSDVKLSVEDIELLELIFTKEIPKKILSTNDEPV